LVSQLKIQPRIRVIKGRDYPYFELDADAFTFTCLSVTGKKAEAFKWAFIEAFKKAPAEAISTRANVAANKNNQHWIEARTTGKKIRIDLTDQIKEFCKYAEDQRGAPYPKVCPYYKLITDAIYQFKNIEQSKGKQPLRDTLSGDKVEAVQDPETRVIKLLKHIITSGGSREGIKGQVLEYLRGGADV